MQPFGTASPKRRGLRSGPTQSSSSPRSSAAAANTAATTTAAATPMPNSATLESTIKSQAALLPNSNISASPPEKTPVALEPTVVLDEHSNYLNHLNQLRRINAGDDLTDRPGYGLYLIRIPVTLSPGPRSRRGKGAIITVSAKSVMTKHTLRDALRNAVINETVNDLTQAINSRRPERRPRPGSGRRNVLTAVLCRHRALPRRGKHRPAQAEAERQLAGELGDEPHHRSARVAAWLRGELQSSYHLLEEAATPVSTTVLAAQVDPLEELGDSILKRDFPRIAQVQPGRSQRLARAPERRQGERLRGTIRSSSE